MVRKRRATGQSSAGKKKGFYRGSAGRKKVAEEQEKAKKRREQRSNQPFRWWMKADTEREMVILDEEPDFFMHEHQIYHKNAKNYADKFEYLPCVKEFDHCAACEHLGKEGYFGMYLTVIDLEEYETAKGDVIPWTRKLFVVKGNQQKKFNRLFEREGSLRGLKILVIRDGDKDPVTGNDFEVLDRIDEKELKKYVRKWKDKDGKAKSEDCSVPYDYETLFEEPDGDKLRAHFGDGPVPGSDEEFEKEEDADYEDDDQDEERWDDKEEEGDLEEDEDEDEDEDEEDDDDAEDEDEDQDEDEDESPRSRRSSRRSKHPAPSRSSRRSRKEEPEDEDDEPPFDLDEDEEDEEDEEPSPRRRATKKRVHKKTATRRTRRSRS